MIGTPQVQFHVETSGQGPVMLLLHGTGASAHSFRPLRALLEKHFTVIAPDLPGHADSVASPSFVPTLERMSAAVADLVKELEVKPEVVVGHSAGAAIGIQLALSGAVVPKRIVGIGAALRPFDGLAASVFPGAARLLARAAAFVPLRVRREATVRHLLEQTGSSLDADGVEAYRRLVARPSHVRAVLAMMSRWDVTALFDALPTLAPPLLLVAGENDRAVPVTDQETCAHRARDGRLVVIAGAGHLVHEERPSEVASCVLEVDPPRVPAPSKFVTLKPGSQVEKHDQ